MYENRSESDHETYATLFCMIGTYMMRNVNSLAYIVNHDPSLQVVGRYCL